MQKLFHFDTEGAPYRADAAVVWCFDDRFTLAVQKVLKRRVELTQAAERVRETFDGIRIECWFADFTGVWRIETARSAGGD